MIDRTRLVRLMVLIDTAIAVDQVTKFVARRFVSREGVDYLGGILRLQLVENHGAFLSLGSALPETARRLVFGLGVGLICAALLFHVIRSKSLSDRERTLYGLVIAGGFGNLIDRLIFQGGVTDFLNLGIGSLRTGIFNLADMYVTFAVLLFLVPSKKSGPST